MNGLIAYWQRYKMVLKITMLLLLLHVAVRLLFQYYNQSFFLLNGTEIFKVYAWGFRLDAIALVLANIPVLLLGFYFSNAKIKLEWANKICRFVFICFNAFALALNVIDAGYFKYTKHRANAELFYIFSDSLGSLPSLLTTFTLLFILFIAIVYVLVILAKQIAITYKPAKTVLLQLVFTALISISIIRGWGEKTIMPTSPLLSIKHENLPLAQNSFHTFFYSLIKKQNRLKPKQFLAQQEVDRLVPTEQYFAPTPDSFTRKNVVICLLESFSREYTEPNHPQKAITPFFDSLIQNHCTNFPNAYGNAYTSAQGIVNVLGSMYTFIDEPFFYSAYNNTSFNAIGNIFKSKGYNTSFFLGAGEDHFGFSKWATMVGIDSLYNRITYNNESDYDGNWGIFDEQFFQYAAAVHNKKQQPFFSVLYNISSHPPFTIPAHLQQQFIQPGKSPAQKAISYVDYSFRRFFETAKTTNWYKNTVFVFVADHWFSPTDKTPYSYTGSSAIPIFIFDPSHNRHTSIPALASQVDVVPTLLDWLHYSGVYTGFGKSLLRHNNNPNYVLSYTGQVIQIITDDFVLGYNEQQEKSVYMYAYKTDRLCKQNLIQNLTYKPQQLQLEKLIQANVQQYNKSLLQRSLYRLNKP